MVQRELGKALGGIRNMSYVVKWIYISLFFNIIPIISWIVFGFFSNDVSLFIALFCTVLIDGMLIYKFLESRKYQSNEGVSTYE
jgi:hypothetical protein